MNKVKKIAIIVVAVIEMVMFSGIFYGYNSLIPIYKDAGVFSQYCENPQKLETISCTTQETYFGRAFVTWLIVQAVMSFVLGVILDKFGIKVIKVIGAICLMGGTLCLAFTPQLNWLLFVAGSLLTMSAHSLGISNISLSVLFSGNGNMFVSLFSALFDVSAIVMTGIKYITNLGAPFWLICTTYGAIGASIMLGSLSILKARAKDLVTETDEIKTNDEKNENVEEKAEEKAEETEKIKVTNDNIDSVLNKYEQSIDETFPNVKSCILSPEYLIQVAFFGILCFRFTFFLAQMSSQLKYLFPTQPDVIDHLLSVSNIFFLGSLFISPLFGVLLDKYQQYTYKCLSNDLESSPRQIYNKINSCFFLPSVICSFVMALASSLLFVSSQYVFYLVFICMTITRSLLFAINGAYVFAAFPKKFFGTLIGAVFLITGFINLLQQFIIQFASPDSHPDIINYILLGLCLVTFGHGLYLKLKK